MASPLTQNVGRAIAPSLSQIVQSQHARQPNPLITHNQTVQQIQRTAQEQVNNPKVLDKHRTPQVPKRVETTYSSKGSKQKPSRPTSVEHEEYPIDEGLDLKV